MRTRTAPAGVALLLTALLAACSGAAGGQPSVDPSTADVQLGASNMAFDQPELTASAGEAFTIGFTNDDSMPHNVAIYTDASKGTRLFEGEVTDRGSVIYEVPALAPGTYYFDCSLHPGMTGTLVVE
ncbi:MAG TPA: cupredoxin domain-containing protein [Candidatus Limnocylindria bacterium]|nr:cupredoxin domain-containing protein [Candidatus Limnocylindria bacterium]